MFLVQTSLITNFNFILLLVLVINLIEDPESNLGIISAFLVGFFIDFNSFTYQFGVFTFSLVTLSLFIKIILAKFLKIPYVSWLPKI
ncbi:MAG: hypothetical protein PHG24_02320 [Candidatus Pacebacteria bacterium]|nr:hypothetical protein [Candidatus Paceibacterota bacterium]